MEPAKQELLEGLRPYCSPSQRTTLEAVLEHGRALLEQAAYARTLATLNQLLPVLVPALDQDWKERIFALRDRAQQGWQQQLGAQVREQLDRLLDGSAEPAAVAERLGTLPTAALAELIGQWSGRLAADEIDSAGEARLTELMSIWAPQLEGYDPAADRDSRLQTLKNWSSTLAPKDDAN